MPARRWRDAAAALALPLSLAVCAAFAPAYAADSAKVLRVAIPVAETGFDPQAAGDAYSNYVNRTIFDPLYKYDYLARPFRLVPNTATALPEISADRLTWTMRVRPGIYFADDPVFKGRRRELTAADYVYAIKRALDPAMRSSPRRSKPANSTTTHRSKACRRSIATRCVSSSTFPTPRFCRT